jgi:class 3 adenylate cyclase/tetratricopeptide (TPR) repeat protein
MACRACGVTNPAGAKFCVECGAPQSVGCPSCGNPIAGGQKFCAECGYRLVDGAAATPVRAVAPAPVVGAGASTERRLVTVLFADLVGFTALAEGRDAEAVRDLLGRYFDVSREIVRRYGGTIEKFIGDAVMAVWGAPVAHEDDAERAVRAGLDLLEAVDHLGRDAGTVALRARVGILTGEAAVNLAATDQGMVAGDLVNTASRLQSVAAPGTVLVGEATFRAAAGAIAFEPAGEQDLKGKAAPVQAWRAVRVVAQVRGRGRSDALEPPFVGRETEFRLLRELYHATGRDRRARLVSLTGQAGIGKSRLAWEFSKYSDGLAETVLWHVGRSPSYGEGIAFWALGEMVRKRAGLAESDDEPTTRAGVGRMLDTYARSAEERAFVEPAVLALLGMGDPGGMDRGELFTAWRTLFERISEEGTVALVFEDLHWADDGLLDFLEHLMEWSRNHPIFVVTLARPELLDRRPTWGGQRGGTSLPLGPLAESEIRTMLTSMVPGLPEAAIRSILDRADGIPLYAVETVRMLVADGRLVLGADGRYLPLAELGSLDVPGSLRGLIAARLDALPAAERALVADGSVLGKTFTVAALASVSGIDVTELETRLRDLDRLELVQQDTDPRSPERGQYGFVQSLIREVAYGTLAKRDRRTKHLAAARYFESLGDDELAGALATHYLAAWQAVPDGDEGAAVAHQARISLRAAADRAMTLGSPVQALAHLDRARQIPGLSPADEAALLERAGDAAQLAGGYEVAQARLGDAVALRRALGDQEALANAIAVLGEAIMRSGRSDLAIDLLERGLAETPDAEGAGLVALLGRLGLAYTRSSRRDEGLALVERMLVIAERLRLHEAVVDGITTRVRILVATGRLIEAAALTDGARRLAEELGMARQAIALVANQVNIASDEDPRRALELSRAGMAMARQLGSTPLLVGTALGGGDSAYHTGEWAASRDAYRDLVSLDLSTSDRLMVVANGRIFDVMRGVRDPDLEGWLDGLMAAQIDRGLETFRYELDFWPAWVAGDYERSIELQLSITEHDSLNAPSAYERAIRAALWLGDAGRARELYDTLAGLGRRARWLDAIRDGVLAGVTALEGDAAEAERLYRDALARLDALGCAFDVAQLALDAVIVLGAGTPIGREMATLARPILERIEVRPYLDRLAALEAAASAAVG